VLTGQAAAIHAGPAIGLSFVVSAVVCAFAGLCYAEMASSVPVSGSAYTYAYATMGRLMAWIIGWDLILEYALGAAGVAVGWSGYVVSFLNDLGLTVPPALTAAPFAYDPAHGEWQRTATLINFPAMLVTGVTSMLLVLGTRESVRINNIIVVLKVAIVVIFIVAAIWFVNSANWVTAGNPEGAFIPANVGPGQFGWSGIMRGAAVVFFAYIGFDAVSTAAQEAIKALPTDKELVAAAQKFVARAQQLTAETATLTKSATEKKSAVAPMTEAWNKTKPPVEAARQKVTPLNSSLKDAEKIMLAARDKAANDKESLESLDRRLVTAQKVAKVPELTQAIIAAKQAIPAREAALASAEKLLAEFVPIAGEREKIAKTAGEASAAAAKAFEAARPPFVKQSEANASIVAAHTAADAARQKLPENAVLADVAKKLEDCHNEAQTKLAELQKNLDAAASSRKAVDEKFVVAQETLAAALAERARRGKRLAVPVHEPLVGLLGLRDGAVPFAEMSEMLARERP